MLQEVAVESEQHRAELQVDRVFHPDMTQEQVYDSLRNCVEHAAEGYNSTVYVQENSVSLPWIPLLCYLCTNRHTLM